MADSGISLVYHSARAKDYLSTIQLQLTPDQIPDSLLKVHIRITIEGVVYEKIFEADPNIRYTTRSSAFEENGGPVKLTSNKQKKHSISNNSSLCVVAASGMQGPMSR